MWGIAPSNFTFPCHFLQQIPSDLEVSQTCEATHDFQHNSHYNITKSKIIILIVKSWPILISMLLVSIHFEHNTLALHSDFDLTSSTKQWEY